MVINLKTFFKTGFFLLLISQTASAQKTISKSDFDQLKLRMDHPKTTKLILDSLWASYSIEPFDILGQGANREDGLIPVYNLYRAYYRENPKCSDCETTINQMSTYLDDQTLKELELQYIKLLEKAEELFLLGDFQKSKEYYQRALVFRPSDSFPKEMLYRIEGVLSGQKSIEYSKEEIDRMGKIADGYFTKKDFVKCKQFYSRVQNLDPTNEYAKSRIEEIETLLKSLK